METCLGVVQLNVIKWWQQQKISSFNCRYLIQIVFTKNLWGCWVFEKQKYIISGVFKYLVFRLSYLDCLMLLLGRGLWSQDVFEIILYRNSLFEEIRILPRKWKLLRWQLGEFYITALPGRKKKTPRYQPKTASGWFRLDNTC